MEDWKEIKDAHGNTQYYFNKKTGVTTIDRPTELAPEIKEDNVASLLKAIDETQQTLQQSTVVESVQNVSTK